MSSEASKLSSDTERNDTPISECPGASHSSAKQNAAEEKQQVAAEKDAPLQILDNKHIPTDSSGEQIFVQVERNKQGNAMSSTENDQSDSTLCSPSKTCQSLKSDLQQGSKLESPTEEMVSNVLIDGPQMSTNPLEETRSHTDSGIDVIAGSLDNTPWKPHLRAESTAVPQVSCYDCKTINTPNQKTENETSSLKTSATKNNVSEVSADPELKDPSKWPPEPSGICNQADSNRPTQCVDECQSALPHEQKEKHGFNSKVSAIVCVPGKKIGEQSQFSECAVAGFGEDKQANVIQQDGEECRQDQHPTPQDLLKISEQHVEFLSDGISQATPRTPVACPSFEISPPPTPPLETSKTESEIICEDIVETFPQCEAGKGAFNVYSDDAVCSKVAVKLIKKVHPPSPPTGKKNEVRKELFPLQSKTRSMSVYSDPTRKMNSDASSSSLKQPVTPDVRNIAVYSPIGSKRLNDSAQQTKYKSRAVKSGVASPAKWLQEMNENLAESDDFLGSPAAIFPTSPKRNNTPVYDQQRRARILSEYLLPRQKCRALKSPSKRSQELFDAQRYPTPMELQNEPYSPVTDCREVLKFAGTKRKLRFHQDTVPEISSEVPSCFTSIRPKDTHCDQPGSLGQNKESPRCLNVAADVPRTPIEIPRVTELPLYAEGPRYQAEVPKRPPEVPKCFEVPNCPESSAFPNFQATQGISCSHTITLKSYKTKKSFLEKKTMHSLPSFSNPESTPQPSSRFQIAPPQVEKGNIHNYEPIGDYWDAPKPPKRSFFGEEDPKAQPDLSMLLPIPNLSFINDSLNSATKKQTSTNCWTYQKNPNSNQQIEEFSDEFFSSRREQHPIEKPGASRQPLSSQQPLQPSFQKSFCNEQPTLQLYPYNAHKLPKAQQNKKSCWSETITSYPKYSNKTELEQSILKCTSQMEDRGSEHRNKSSDKAQRKIITSTVSKPTLSPTVWDSSHLDKPLSSIPSSSSPVSINRSQRSQTWQRYPSATDKSQMSQDGSFIQNSYRPQIQQSISLTTVRPEATQTLQSTQNSAEQQPQQDCCLSKTKGTTILPRRSSKYSYTSIAECPRAGRIPRDQGLADDPNSHINKNNFERIRETNKEISKPYKTPFRKVQDMLEKVSSVRQTENSSRTKEKVSTTTHETQMSPISQTKTTEDKTVQTDDAEKDPRYVLNLHLQIPKETQTQSQSQRSVGTETSDCYLPYNFTALRQMLGKSFKSYWPHGTGSKNTNNASHLRYHSGQEQGDSGSSDESSQSEDRDTKTTKKIYLSNYPSNPTMKLAHHFRSSGNTPNVCIVNPLLNELEDTSTDSSENINVDSDTISENTNVGENPQQELLHSSVQSQNTTPSFLQQPYNQRRFKFPITPFQEVCQCVMPTNDREWAYQCCGVDPTSHSMPLRRSSSTVTNFCACEERENSQITSIWNTNQDSQNDSRMNQDASGTEMREDENQPLQELTLVRGNDNYYDIADTDDEQNPQSDLKAIPSAIDLERVNETTQDQFTYQQLEEMYQPIQVSSSLNEPISPPQVHTVTTSQSLPTEIELEPREKKPARIQITGRCPTWDDVSGKLTTETEGNMHANSTVSEPLIVKSQQAEGSSSANLSKRRCLRRLGDAKLYDNATSEESANELSDEKSVFTGQEKNANPKLIFSLEVNPTPTSQDDRSSEHEKAVSSKTLVSPPGDGEAGDGEAGDGEAGDGEAGDGEAGDGEAGDGEAGDGETGEEATETALPNAEFQPEENAE